MGTRRLNHLIVTGNTSNTTNDSVIYDIIRYLRVIYYSSYERKMCQSNYSSDIMYLVLWHIFSRSRCCPTAGQRDYCSKNMQYQTIFFSSWTWVVNLYWIRMDGLLQVLHSYWTKKGLFSSHFYQFLFYLKT